MKDSKQKFIVIEEIDNFFRVSDILVDENKNIKLVDININNNFSDLNIKKTGKPNIVLGLNSNHATTVLKKISLKRSLPNKEINEGELDQLIFKTLWIFLDDYRNWSAKKMNIIDLNLVLAEVEIKNVTLDSKNVLNPLGLKGKELDFKVKGTLIPRKYLDYIENLKDFAENIKVVERLSVVSIFSGVGDFQFHIGSKHSEVFSLNDGEIKYKKKISWGNNDIIELISNKFYLDKRISNCLIKKYFDEKMSPDMIKLIDNLIEDNLEKFEKNIKNITKKRKVDIFVNVFLPVYEKVLSENKKTKHLDLSKILENKGFNVIIKPNNKLFCFQNNYEPIVLVAFELFSNCYDELNKILKRRSKWLVPNI